MAKKAAKGAAAKKKRTVSGKRGKPGKKTNQGVDPRGVAGIAVLCLGLLALFCQFIPSNGGFLNRCMLIVRGLGGMLCLLLPVVVCWAGVVLVFFGERKLSARTLILSSLIFLFVEAMFQLFRISGVNAALAADGAQASYGAFLARSFTMSSLDCKGGGLIGALLAWPLYKGLDIWGGMIVLIFATAIALMTLTGFSFGGIGMRISEWADDFRVEMRERREEKDALRDARQEEELERENALAIERQKRRQERLQKHLLADKLATKTTSLSGSSSNRITNVRLAAEKINGVILQPGQTFSYNDVLGQRTKANGFKEAGAYSGGQVVQEVGGGICQVSSTLYYCAMVSNLKINTRTCHYFPVAYIEPGMDATVSWGGPEFKFTNNRDYPIEIKAYVQNGSVTVEIWGTDVDGSYVKMSYTANGLRATTYRTVYDKDGKQISHTLEANSTYHSHDTAPKPTPTPTPKPQPTPYPSVYDPGDAGED